MAISFKFGYKLSTDQLDPFAILRHLEWILEKSEEKRPPLEEFLEESEENRTPLKL